MGHGAFSRHSGTRELAGEPSNDFGTLLPTTMLTQIGSRKASESGPNGCPDSSNSLLGRAPGCSASLASDQLGHVATARSELEE
jgi:hypothetical protein